MALVYKNCDGANIPQHVCDDCVGGEQGGIRSIALVKKNFQFTDTDIVTKVKWVTGIENGDIIVIPSTRGTFDGGSPVTAPGYGDIANITTGYNFTLTARDPAYKQNQKFWNAIAKRKDLKVAFRTKTLVHISDVPVSITPTNPVEEGTETIVDWQLSFAWTSTDLPEPHDATALTDEIFTCFEVKP